jgi:hypothetical protein
MHAALSSSPVFELINVNEEVSISKDAGTLKYQILSLLTRSMGFVSNASLINSAS